MYFFPCRQFRVPRMWPVKKCAHFWPCSALHHRPAVAALLLPRPPALKSPLQALKSFPPAILSKSS